MPPEIIPQLFNSYVEIHAAQLGLLVGLFVGLLYWADRRLAFALLFASVIVALGNGAEIGYGDIDRKPWYFMSVLYVTTLGNILIVEYGPAARGKLAALLGAKDGGSMRDSGVNSRSGADVQRRG